VPARRGLRLRPGLSRAYEPRAERGSRGKTGQRRVKACMSSHGESSLLRWPSSVPGRARGGKAGVAAVYGSPYAGRGYFTGRATTILQTSRKGGSDMKRRLFLVVIAVLLCCAGR